MSDITNPLSLYKILDPHPGGLLPLFYWNKFHNAYRKAFHASESTAMRELFGVKEDDAKEVIRIRKKVDKIGDEANPTEAEKQEVVQDAVSLFAGVVHGLLYEGDPLFKNDNTVTTDPHKLYNLLDPHPEGILALMYWVKFDRPYRVAFHTDEEASMAVLFGIHDGALKDQVLDIRSKYVDSLDPAAGKDQQKAVEQLVVQLFADHVARDLVWGTDVFW
jgi:hypothetical protein